MDKILHALIGFVVAWRLIAIHTNWVYVLLIVSFMGAIKELYDYKTYGKYDYKDMLATIGGGIALLITTL